MDQTPRGLGDTLRRLGPALRSVNIDVKIDSKPQRDGYHVHLNWDESEDEDEYSVNFVNIVKVLDSFIPVEDDE